MCGIAKLDGHGFCCRGESTIRLISLICSRSQRCMGSRSTLRCQIMNSRITGIFTDDMRVVELALGPFDCGNSFIGEAVRQIGCQQQIKLR